VKPPGIRLMCGHAFIRGDCRRLRVGVYLIMYVVEDDIITIEQSLFEFAALKAGQSILVNGPG
jgi:hypothetical protein